MAPPDLSRMAPRCTEDRTFGRALRRARRLAPKGSEIYAHVSFASADGMSVAS